MYALCSYVPLRLSASNRSKKKPRSGGNAVVELTEKNFEEMVLQSDEVRRSLQFDYPEACAQMRSIHSDARGGV